MTRLSLTVTVTPWGMVRDSVVDPVPISMTSPGWALAMATLSPAYVTVLSAETDLTA